MKTTQEKIEAFIARANDPASSETEKQKATEMAQKLILESGIVPDFENEEILFFTYESSGRIENWKFVLWYQLCKFMGAYGVKKGNKGERGNRLGFYGYTSQAQPIFAMADHFFNAIENLGRTKHGYGRSYVASYKLGLAYGVVAKFENRLPDELQEKALVFVNSAERIKNELGRKTKASNIELRNKQAVRDGFYTGLKLEDAKAIEQGSVKATKFLGQEIC